MSRILPCLIAVWFVESESWALQSLEERGSDYPWVSPRKVRTLADLLI